MSDVLEPVAQLESMLFVASGPVSVGRLAKALAVPQKRVRALLDELVENYDEWGLRLQWSGDLVQMTTAPEAGEAVERFLGLEVSSRLSQAALEVLAMVAYLQPTTRPDIDGLRGVNSDGALRTLLNKGLIEEVGRKETPGRPILYGTTPTFLQHFGLSSVAELPLLVDEEE